MQSMMLAAVQATAERLTAPDGTNV